MLPLAMFLAGALLAIQAAINSALARALGQQPLLASLISFVVGSLFLSALFLAQRSQEALPRFNLAWWHVLGGFLGACFVYSVILATPRLGVAVTLLCVLLGQMCCAAVLDHYGLLALPARPVQPLQLAGIALVGLGLIFYFQGRQS